MPGELEYEFEYENEFNREEVAAILEKLAAGLRKGTLNVDLENSVLKMKVDEDVEIAVEAERCMGLSELIVEMRWGRMTGDEAEEEEESVGEEEEGAIEEDEDVRNAKKGKGKVLPTGEDVQGTEEEAPADDNFDTHEI